MDARWKEIITCLAYMKPDSVDKDKIKATLEWDRTYDCQVIDTLYIDGILTFDEYLDFFGKLIEHQKEHLKWNERYFEEAKEKGKEYNPMAHYCLASNFPESIYSKLNEQYK